MPQSAYCCSIRTDAIRVWNRSVDEAFDCHKRSYLVQNFAMTDLGRTKEEAEDHKACCLGVQARDSQTVMRIALSASRHSKRAKRTKTAPLTRVSFISTLKAKFKDGTEDHSELLLRVTTPYRTEAKLDLFHLLACRSERKQIDFPNCPSQPAVARQRWLASLSETTVSERSGRKPDRILPIFSVRRKLR